MNTHPARWFRWFIDAAATITVLLGTSCSEKLADEPIGTSGDAIINGQPVANPQDTGHVQVGPGSVVQGSLTSIRQGSGTLLDNSTALSAAHVLDQSNCPFKQGATGNQSIDCFFRPDSHVVALGNNVPSPPPAQKANRISVHPRYIPFKDPSDDTGVDVATLRTGAPFTIQGSTSSFQQLISSLPTPPVNTIATCFGYGQSTFNAPSTGGILRESFLTVSSVDASKEFFTMLPGVGGVIPFAGDSGGPCFGSGSFAVDGVIRNVTLPNQNLPPISATAVAASTFRNWANLVQQSLLDFNILDVDFDGIPDSIFLLRNQTSQVFPGLFWEIKLLTSAPGSLCEDEASCRLDIFQDTGVPVPTLALVGGDFDGNGLPDVVGQINNSPFFFSSSALGSFVNANFAFLPSTYENFVVGDFNEDGTPDLEARDTNGFVDLYFGQPGVGLRPGLQAGGFPAMSGEDGKLATVSGKGNATVNFPKVRVFITVPGAQTTFDVHIFDGDQSGADDVAGGLTCYTLFADGGNTGDPNVAVPIAATNSGVMKEHAWSNVFSGFTQPEAKGPSGDFFYFMDAELVDGTCAAPSVNNLAAINSFLVRASGDVEIESDELSVMGWDSIGDAAPASLGSFVSRDNAYDGTFTLWTDPGIASVSLTFRDADADDLDDALDPAGLFGPEDVQSPGVAAGANSEIGYQIRDNDGFNNPGNLILDVQNPSGNNDVTGPLRDVELHDVPTAGQKTDGGWFWTWTHVLSGNNVHIFVPTSNTSNNPRPTLGNSPNAKSLGSPLRLAAKPLRPLHWSTARARDFWLANPGAITPLLPITLGTSDGQILVSDVATALAILAETDPSVGGANGQKVALCHRPPGNPATQKTLVVGASALQAHLAHGDTLGPTQALAALAAELLATKLNIKGAAPREKLSATRIYGTGDTVGATVSSADGDVVGLDTVCNADAGGKVMDIEALTRLLLATNHAQVTNFFPKPNIPAKSPVPKNAQSSPATGGL